MCAFVSSVALQLAARSRGNPDEGRDPQSRGAHPDRCRAHYVSITSAVICAISENSFKVTLAVIADPTVSGQQSFIIDRGETGAYAGGRQAAAGGAGCCFPAYVEEAFRRRRAVRHRNRVGSGNRRERRLADDVPVSEASDGETDADGHKRNRGGGGGRPSGEARDGGPAREESEIPRVVSETAGVAGVAGDETESRGRRRGAARRGRADQGQAAAKGRARRGRSWRSPSARGPKMVWPDRLRTNWGRPRSRKRPMRFRFRWKFGRAGPLLSFKPESIAPSPERQYRIMVSGSAGSGLARPCRRTPPRGRKEPRGRRSTVRGKGELPWSEARPDPARHLSIIAATAIGGPCPGTARS